MYLQLNLVLLDNKITLLSQTLVLMFHTLALLPQTTVHLNNKVALLDSSITISPIIIVHLQEH